MHSNTTAEETLNFILDIISEGIWDWDAVTGRVERSPGWYSMLGYPHDYFNKDVLTWENIIHPEDYPTVMAHFEDYIHGRIPEYRIRYRCLKANGEPLWIEDSGKIVAYKSDGSVARMIGAHNDIHQCVMTQKQLEDQRRLLEGDEKTLEEMSRERTAEITSLNRKLAERIKEVEYVATHDNLTRVFNRGMFQELLDIEIKRTHRYGYPLSLILVDVDYFKEINDRYGHLTGDKVLINIAQRLSAHIRESDALARWGGEEFAIILPNTAPEQCKELADRLRHEIAVSPMLESICITCSFGVTTFQEGDTAQDLFNRMDNALYQAKRLNRNNVQVL